MGVTKHKAGAAAAVAANQQPPRAPATRGPQRPQQQLRAFKEELASWIKSGEVQGCLAAHSVGLPDTMFDRVSPDLRAGPRTLYCNITVNPAVNSDRECRLEFSHLNCTRAVIGQILKRLQLDAGSKGLDTWARVTSYGWTLFGAAVRGDGSAADYCSDAAAAMREAGMRPTTR